MSASEDSSLLAASEEAATFTTILAAAMAAKPLTDIMKYARKRHVRDKKYTKGEDAKKIAACRWDDGGNPSETSQSCFTIV
ncbi:hypothetical protein MNV49_001513 [Pseudohyphozyma bogoriensis]|nr:hypothetical protein MNV49_001513 [Pseudohyphozyma bogoriensis]